MSEGGLVGGVGMELVKCGVWARADNGGEMEFGCGDGQTRAKTDGMMGEFGYGRKDISIRNRI